MNLMSKQKNLSGAVQRLGPPTLSLLQRVAGLEPSPDHSIIKRFGVAAGFDNMWEFYYP